jgi:putative drug exporter of the RND superfamily
MTADQSARGVLRWLVPALLVVAWLGLGGVLGPFTGKLAEVQTNDAAAFLPADAESTRVADVQRQVSGQDALPAIAVFEYDTAVTEADLAVIEELAGEIAQIDGVVGDPAPPVPSEDGRAVQLILQVDAAQGAAAGDVVAEIRAVLAEVPDSDVYVAGPAGFVADLGEAFGDIDGLLLRVALVAVLVILLVVYRSPLLPFVVLTSAVLALSAAAAVVYRLADGGVITLNGQSQGIMFILVVGAATDYALLLVARFREELRDRGSRFAAMRAALRGALPAIVASGGTVILGVLCLLASELNSNRDLGPVAAIGIAFSMVAALTFLPAVLLLLGRAAFWPFRPRLGSAHPERAGLWGSLAGLVGRRPRRVWVVTVLGLAALGAFVPRLDADGVPQRDLFLSEVESVTGQDVLAEHFPAGAGSPALVAAPVEEVAAVADVVAADPGVADTAMPQAVANGYAIVTATLTDAADSAAAERTVQRLRASLDELSTDVLVGGDSAVQLDTNEASARDRLVIIPLVLVVVYVVIAILLRALVAPAVVLLANVLSFAATLGVAALVFEFVFGFDGIDPAVPLFGFVFLIALGIDYSIFLMTRVREEALAAGTRPGILRGLSVTGGVITSAGLVLAATFSALAVVPIAFLLQIAFIVAFGVLLDTFVVRSLLVPALSYDIGRKVWWPGRLAAPDSGPPEGLEEVSAPAGAIHRAD